MSETDWIVPGAAVVLYSSGGPSRNYNPTHSRIKKVATKSFSVEDDREPRFDLRSQTARQGGSWGWTRHCVPADSPEAAKVLAAVDRGRKANRARGAVDEWIRVRSRDARLAAIAALEAVQD